MKQLQRQRMILRAWIGLGTAFLMLAFVAALHTFSWGLPTLFYWTSDTAASVMAGSGAIAAIFFGIAQFGDQQIVQRSKHCLDAATDGIRRALVVIAADDISRNIAWVNAARLIRRSLRLADNLSEPDHIETWKLFREEWRIRFLKYVDGDLSYYFGFETYSPVKQLKVTDALIVDYAKHSLRERSLDIAGLDASQSGSTMIGLRALKVVYDFVTEYDHADEALEGVVGFTEADQRELLNRDHYGLLAYLKTLTDFTIIGGEAHRNKKP